MLDFAYLVLRWVLTALPFVVAVLLPLLLALFVAGLYSNPVVGAVSILLLFLLETVLIHLIALNLGITVFPQDLLFVPMALAALMRLFRPGSVRRVPKPLWILAGVMTLSFIVGLAQHGTTSGVEFRSDFYFMVGLFYFSSFEWTSQQVSRVLNWLLPVALLIMLIVWYRWLADAANLDWVDPVWRNIEAGDSLRVLDAQQTLFLGTALILVIYAMATGSSLAGWLFLVPTLALTVLVLQHRSVWVASFLPAMMAFVIVRKSQGKLIGRLAAIAAISAIVLLPLLATGKFSSATSSIADSAERATSTTSGTFVGRIEGWDALLKKWVASGPRTWAMGNSYGSGYERKQQGGRDVTFAPHNYFVQLLLRTGLIGLLAFLALHWYLLKGAIRLGGAPHAALSGYAMIGLLVSALLYYIPYSPPYIHGLITGMILGLLLQHDTALSKGEYAQAVSLKKNTGRVSSSGALASPLGNQLHRR